MMAFTDDGQVCRHFKGSVAPWRSSCPYTESGYERLPCKSTSGRLLTPNTTYWQVCDDLVWERDARYGIDSRARAQNRQVGVCWNALLSVSNRILCSVVLLLI